MPNTTYLTLPYPSLANSPNVPQDMQNLAAGLDSKLGGVILCTSSTRPTGRNGAVIFQTDTGTYMFHNGSAWVPWNPNNLFKYKTANETVNNTTTLQNDDDLFAAVLANSVYLVTGNLRVASQTNADFIINWTAPSGYAFDWSLHTLAASAASITDDYLGGYAAGSQPPLAGLGGSTVIAKVEGLLTIAGTAGTFRLQWAQNTAQASGTSLLSGSWLNLSLVA